MTDVATRSDGRNPSQIDWSAIEWPKVEREVFRLQKRIYQASQRGNLVQVRKLQRLLIRSWHARLLAVRRVTQDNRGKRTAGVDGVKSIRPAERGELARQLRPRAKTPPLRRIWIPKKGNPQEKRPLGIPTIRVRAEQALVKLMLEPEWEARFEPNSYGFRPGRSAHDATQGIYASIQNIPKFVLDADIRTCFDRIDHDALLGKLKAPPFLRRVIKAWLKAGVLDQGEFAHTFKGTPQGGVISPLLANIALHGLESLMASVPRPRGTDAPRLIRYADDFVILHPDLATIERSRASVDDWLRELGLELKAEKTRITHTLTPHQGAVGFNFLGFTVRQYPVGKTHRIKKVFGHFLPFTPRITPSKESLKSHYSDLEQAIEEYQHDAQSVLIRKLNPMIVGWAHYFRHQVSKKAFNKVDDLLFYRLFRWACYRHANKNGRWIFRKYWKRQGGSRWVFMAPSRKGLLSHSAVKIERYGKVAGSRSPFDGDWIYWASRLGRFPDVSPSAATLLKRQKGKCPWCHLYFRHGDLLARDHKIPRSQGGDDAITNRQLLHGHCHVQKTRIERPVGGQTRLPV